MQNPGKPCGRCSVCYVCSVFTWYDMTLLQPYMPEVDCKGFK